MMKKILMFAMMLFMLQPAYSQSKDANADKAKEKQYQENTYGHIVRKAKAEKGFNVKYFYDGLAPLEKDGKWGFMNTDMELVIPMKYDAIGYFSEEYRIASVGLNKKYGFIDRKGREMIPIKYDKTSEFKDGAAVVHLNNKGGLIGTNGDLLTQIKYDLMTDPIEGNRVVEFGGKQGVINNKGKEIIPVKYDEVLRFNTGKISVTLNKKYGVFNADGIEILPVLYEAVVLNTDGFYSLLNDELAFHNNTGSKISFDKKEAIKTLGGISFLWLNSEKMHDRVQSLFLALYAADAGDDQGMYALSLMYNSAKKYTESLEWAQKSAEKGNIDALFFLAKKYHDGKDVEKDYAKVAKYFTLILDQKPDKERILTVYSMLNSIYFEGGYGLKIDKKKADHYNKLHYDLLNELYGRK